MATKDKIVNLEDLKVLSDHVEGEVTDLKSDITRSEQAIINGYFSIDKADFVSGLFRSTYGIIANSKAYVAGPFPVKAGDTVLIDHGTLFVNMIVANGNETIQTITGSYASFSEPTNLLATVSVDGDLYINVRNAKTDANATAFPQNNIDVIVQINSTFAYKLQKELDSTENDLNLVAQAVENMLHKTTNANNLRWRYGDYSRRGNFEYSLAALCNPNYYMAKAGDTITCDSNTEFQVGGKINASDTSYTIYRGYSGNSYTFENDCVMRIGVRYTDNRVLNNFSILDTIHLNLSTGELNDPLDKRESTNYAGIPTGLYIGKHIDTTNFGQSTQYATVIAAWDAIADGKYITKEDLGETYDGNHIYCYTLNPNTKKDVNSVNLSLYGKGKPTIIVISGMHGHEKAGTYGLLYMIDDMLNHSEDDPVLAYLRSNIIFKIIPACNVYGWNNNSRYNQNGVNLNRNFGAKSWENYNIEDSDEPFEYNYKGTAPFSELETKYIRNVITKNPNAALIVDWHTNGLDTITWPSFAWFTHPYRSTGDYDKRLANAAIEMRNMLNPFIKDLYDIPADSDQIIGNAVIEENDPTLTTWGIDGTDTLSTTLETSPGSTTGFLGTKLTKYSPDVIKMSAEIFVNYIIRILGELK